MLNVQYDLGRKDVLKDILLRLRGDEEKGAIRADVTRFIGDVGLVGSLLIMHTLMEGDMEGEITVEDVERLSILVPEMTAIHIADSAHPVHVFMRENAMFLSALEEMTTLFKSMEQEASTEVVDELQQLIRELGTFHQHYHRKEKLLFPIIERHGHYQFTRMMWKGDDRVRALYQGIKRRIDQYPNTNLGFVQKRFQTFKKAFERMVFLEETILFPIVADIFTEEDWRAVAVESEAYGYAMIEVDEVWRPDGISLEGDKAEVNEIQTNENFRFGGGYLTVEEANLIFNHLPLEITFVDKNSVFKYFNEVTNASDMMLVRTPISIGRNVANCHPPKSLLKVMTLIRDLISKKRRSESMWFKKKDQYIHLTYKALFNEDGEYMGILEYVQDIQPFFELPEEIKMGLSPIEK